MERARDGDQGEGAKNPYLALREAKIARNERRLGELGLLKPPTPRPSAALSTARARAQSRRKDELPLAHRAQPRRSGRLSSRTKPDYKDWSEPSSMGRVAGRKRPLSPVATKGEVREPVAASAPSERRARPAPPSAPAANSVRLINLDVTKLLMGEGGEAGMLGRMAEQTGKESIVCESFSRAASSEEQLRLGGTKLSFNKYCGVQEWGNCIFLWVNLGNVDSPNDFLEGGRRVTWFGGSRMHDESPVIHRLLGKGRGTVAAVDGDEDAHDIILFCRLYQLDAKKFTPYVCFGRMAYHSHVPGSRPLSFVWDLLDYDELNNHDYPAVREIFDSFTKR
ncbi:hypothetical protein ACHAWF_007354 [Thalassiosira exigua]